MVLPLVVWVLAAAPASNGPTIDVLLSRRVGLSESKALELADQVSHALEAEGIAVSVAPPAAAQKLAELAVSDTAKCEGREACIATLGAQLHADVVIGVDLGQVSTEVAVHLIALRPGKTPQKLAEDTLIAGIGAPNLEFAVRPFAHQLQDALASRAEAPLQPKLTPSPAVVAQGPSEAVKPSKLPVYAAGAGAVVAGGLAAYFLATALHLEGELDSSRYVTASGVQASNLTRAEADSKVSSANRDNAIGIVSGVVATGLAALTVHLIGASK